MRTNDRFKAQAFIMYADDTEGMDFDAVRDGKGYKIVPRKGTNYDPQVIRAVWRNFNHDWKVSQSCC